MRGLRSALLKKVFNVKTVNGMFSDAVNTYAASAAAITATTPTRVGQLMIGQSAGTWTCYRGIATGTAATGTTGWEALTIP